MSIEVKVPDGFRATGIRKARAGELYVGSNGVQPGPSSYEEIIVVPSTWTEHTETVDCNAPEGWEVVRWGIPAHGEHYIGHDPECPTKCSCTMDTKWLIVKRASWVPAPSCLPLQRARFRDYEDDNWYEGFLGGQGKDGHFLDEDGTPWKYCEVLRDN